MIYSYSLCVVIDWTAPPGFTAFVAYGTTFSRERGNNE